MSFGYLAAEERDEFALAVVALRQSLCNRIDRSGRPRRDGKSQLVRHEICGLA
jgi:hypothetical protein